MSIAVNARITDQPVSHPWLLAIPMILGLLTLGINVTSMNIALPRIMVGLGAELRQIQWVQTAFMITQAIMMPTVGWLGARLGNKNLYMTSLVSFIVGSALCGMAWDVHSLIFFRVLQATGGGTLMPVTMAILYDRFPHEKRGLAMGLFNFAYGLGPAVGPPLNGFLIQELSWRAVFYINIPVGLISLTTAVLFLSKGPEQQRKAPLDYHGFITMALFLITLLTALAQGRHEGWDSTYILSLFTMSSMFFLAFVFVELRAKTPLVELRTYSNFAFSMASIVALLTAVGFRGANFLVDVFLQTIMDFLPFQAGVLMVPGAIILALTGLASGRLSDSINPKILMVFGAVVSFVALYGFSFISVLTTSTFIVILLIGRMLGGACIMSPLAIVAFKSLPEERIRLASGLLTLNRSIGASLAIAIAVTLLENRREVYAIQFSQSMDRIAPGTQNFMFTIQQSLLHLGDAGNLARSKSLLLLRSMALEEAAARAYQDVFFLVGMLFLVTIIPILLCGRKRHSGKKARQ